MDGAATKIGANIAASQFKSALDPGPTKFKTDKKIDWMDLNYPPFIKLFHYDIDEIEDDYRRLFLWVELYFMAFGGFFVLNFFNTIVQVSVGYPATRILASLFYFVLLISLAGFGFYKLFQEAVTLKKPEKTVVRQGSVSNKSFLGRTTGPIRYYKISYFVLYFLLFFQFFLDTLCWNSLMRMINLYKESHAFAGTMCLIEFFVTGVALGGGIFITFVKIKELPIWEKSREGTIKSIDTYQGVKEELEQSDGLNVFNFD